MSRGAIPPFLRGRLAAVVEALVVSAIIGIVLFTTGPLRSDNLPGIPAGASAADGMITSASELAGLATSGSAWLFVKETADGPLGTPDLKDQDNRHSVKTLAVALAYARTGSATYRSKAHSAIMASIGTESPADHNNVLGVGRNLAPLVMAADLIRLRDYAADNDKFRSWLANIRTKNLGGHSRWYTLTGTHEDSPNNWGAFAGASRIAASLYIGDTNDVERAARIYRGFLGDRSAWANFESPTADMLTWTCATASTFTPVNGPCTKSGRNLDGAIPADISRSGPFAWPPGGTAQGYMLESLQGLVVQAELLRRAGYDAYGWEDQGLRRIARFISSYSGWNTAMANRHVPWLLNKRYGLSIATDPALFGRAFGYTDWLYGPGGSSGSAPTATPKPTQTPTPGPTTTPAPTDSPTPTPTPTPTPSPPSGSTLSVTIPVVRLTRSTSFSTSSVPVAVGWSLDGGSGTLSRYQLQVSRDGGSWSTIALASRTTHLVGLRLATGHHYRYRARAIATTGQAGSWSTGPTVTVRGISDRSSAVRYSSGWSSASLSSYINSEVRYTRTSQATATLLFDGRSVSWNGPAGPTRGSAKVYLDGHYVATVSAYASSFSARRVLFAYRAGTAGSHTLTIKALGTSGHPVVAIDWFTALSG